MNILFPSINKVDPLAQEGIYDVLLKQFLDNGHTVYIIKPVERREKRKASVRSVQNLTIIEVNTLNLFNTNLLEKGLSNVFISHSYYRAIKEFISGVKIDLILSATPPVMLSPLIKQLRKDYPEAKTYLMLKDIFPQNAVDIEMIKKGGLLYKWFRKQERELYVLSDHIGCMSLGNKDFILKHNDYLAPENVEILPNATIIREPTPISLEGKREIRTKYGIPEDAVLFLYGGNFGKPQGIDFIIKVLEDNINKSHTYFFFVGKGTEFHRVENFIRSKKPRNISVHSFLPKQEYDRLMQVADVGLIFLDYRFTIPNFPSRLLSIIGNKQPVLMASDPNTDMPQIIRENDFGYTVLSNDVAGFTKIVDHIISHPEELRTKGKNGYEFLKANYDVRDAYKTIMKHFE